MNAESIRKLFEQVRRGKLSADEAVERLRHLPFEDLGFAKVDHHRALRNGMPEVIFGQGQDSGPDNVHLFPAGQARGQHPRHAGE